MASIKTIRGQKRLNGSNPRTGGQAMPTDTADVSAISGGTYINYYPSKKAFEVAKEWTNGVDLEWELGDQGQPILIHLTPASGRGFGLRRPPSQRPHYALPTGDVGVLAVDIGLNPAEEVSITAAAISVKLPFAFDLPAAVATAEAEAMTEATENVEA